MGNTMGQWVSGSLDGSWVNGSMGQMGHGSDGSWVTNVQPWSTLSGTGSTKPSRKSVTQI